MARKPAAPPLIVIYGDDEHQRATAVTAALDELLPPPVDRALALTVYDGGRSADQGGPSLAAVLEDLATLPFLAERRVVLIRDAEAFISAHRERLERYAAAPAPTGVLILECRSFPKTTRLYKAAVAAGGRLCECKKLYGRELVAFVIEQARARGKRLDPAAGARLTDLVGQDTGILAAEIEKLALYVGDRSGITDRDVTELVGQSREEKVFAVMDAAAAGRLPDALRLWHQVLSSDPAAVYRAVGGMTYVVRRWLAAHRLRADGASIRAIAPKLMMWGREQELETLLARLTPQFLRRLLAAIADLDSQAKVGARSIETGVEMLLLRLAAAA
jgi:DNA polymerase-3 subunit delta